MLPLIERPVKAPNRCAAIPFLSSSNPDPEGFFDTGMEMPGFDNHIYVSVTYVRQAAEYLGYVRAEEAHDLRASVLERDARIAQLEAEAADRDREFDAIDILASRGFTARKKPGRKPSEKVAAND